MSGGHCLLFCQSHRANGWLTEHRGRDGVVIHHLGLAAKLGLRKGHCLADGHRRQFPATGHIPQCIDAGFFSLKRIIDLDVASFGERHPGMLESQLCNIRSATGRVQHGIEGLVTVREMGDYATGLGLQRRDMVVEAQVHAGFAHFFAQKLANVVIKTAEKQLAAITLDNVGAQAREDAGEFGGDITTTHNEQSLWKALHIENLVRGQRQLDAGDLRHGGPGAGGE